MTNPPSNEADPIANRLGVSVERVARTLALLDEGNTVAFIARFRKDQTGGLDEEQVRLVWSDATQARQLAERRASVLKLIDGQGKLTTSLRRRIESAKSAKRLEDLYSPFKSNKPSLAMQARERGLQPLADQVLGEGVAEWEQRAQEFASAESELPTTADVLAGVKHLVTESFAERIDLRAKLRPIFVRTGKLVCNKCEPTSGTQPEQLPASSVTTADGESTASQETVEPSAPAKVSVRQRKRSKLENSLRDYFDYSEAVGKVRPHRVLAINRGERAKILRVRVDCDMAELNAAASKILIDPSHPNRELLDECLRNAVARSIVPSLEREVRRELSEGAETHATEVFSKNLRGLFLQRPVHGRRVLAIDPGFKSGCHLVALDEFGAVLQHETSFLIGDDEKRQAARAKIVEFVTSLDLSVIAIGNGTACREAEKLVAAALGEELKDRGVEYVVVNEAGASVYSTSPIGREELPDLEATTRSAVSIGRRLLEPLSELVKINPANIGVGLYQHDVKAKNLRESLDAVVESCVNFVGVDVNSASPALLSYVSGLNQLTARRLYEHRLEHGPFRNREQLREVPGIGEATFVQAAGFLKITGGDNPLDATWIHPESYDTANQVLERLGSNIDELGANIANYLKDHDETASSDSSTLDSASSHERLPELAAELGVGELLLQDIIDALAKPGRDPRDDLPAPTFRSGIIKIDDIEVGMELSGTVLNVVDFGAFVDIGISDTSLIHISRLADRYIRDPHDVVSIGDVLRVWVLEVDRDRRRVVLTAISPEQRSKARSSPRKERPARSKQQPSKGKSQKSKKAPPRQSKFKKARHQKTSDRKPAKPRVPAKPITPKMVEGKEPMRTFSDLIQYYEVKKTDDKSDKQDE